MRTEKIYKGKSRKVTTYQYNDKGLLVKTESFGEKGKVLSSSVFDYVY